MSLVFQPLSNTKLVLSRAEEFWDLQSQRQYSILAGELHDIAYFLGMLSAIVQNEKYLDLFTSVS